MFKANLNKSKFPIKLNYIFTIFKAMIPKSLFSVPKEKKKAVHDALAQKIEGLL